MSDLATFEEAISLVKFVRSCIADRIMSSMSEVHSGTVEVEQDQLFMWRKLLNQSLDAIENMEQKTIEQQEGK